jgi:DNA adenine methylase
MEPDPDRCSPLLRWVGGKARIIERLVPYFLEIQPGQRYFEPFVGAASVFFRRRPQNAVLGDQNADLIDCYRRVRERPDLVWRHLRPMVAMQGQSDYLRLRAQFNESEPSCRRAALFIYLNKTSFNGIWRVNRAGKYNVPYGAKGRPGFPDGARLAACSLALAKSELRANDFEKVLVDVRSGDHVYLDPPYMPLTTTAFFTHYTSTRFSVEDHERLAIMARELAVRGAHVLLTQGDSPLVRKWYRDFVVSELDVRRFVSSGREKHLARELVITSYSPRVGTASPGAFGS